MFDMSIHSSDMSIIQKFMTNQIAVDEIIIVMMPILSSHTLQIQGSIIQKGNLLNLKGFGESKCPGYQNFL